MHDFSRFPELDTVAARELRVLVLTGYGLNCEAETAAGFKMLGAQVDLRHVADVLDGGPDVLRPYGLLAFIGGFSFGDHVASGRVLANRLRHRHAMSLEAFMYSYGCHRIVSKTFFDKSLDKLDLMAKFLIFPKLIAGNSPPKEGKGTAYPLIEKLVKSRNDLVHYKQTEMSLNEAVEKGKAMELDARNAITAVRLAIAQLSAIDNNISENEIRFLDDAAAGNGIPDELIEHELPSIDPELDD